MQDTKKEFVFSGSKVFDESGALIEERLQQNRVPAEFKRKIYNRQSHEIISTSELMHRRRAFINYGGWRFTRECEWDILNRWLKNKATYLYTNKYTVNLTTKNNKGVPYKF
jgi:hypothetical protein